MIRFRAAWTLLGLFFLMIGWAPAARADTVCQATSPTALSFGNASTTQATDSSTTFTVRCTTTALSLLANTKVRMCIGLGPGSTGGTAMLPRQMTDASSDVLRYQLYTDASRSQVWGALGNPSVSTTLVVDFDYAVPVLSGGSTTKTITIYGRVPSGQPLAVGSYASTFSGAGTVLTYSANTSLVGAATQPSACNLAGAITATDAFPFTVSAQVPGQCYAYGTTDLDFGSVPGFITSNADQASTIGMTCTLNTAWQLGLDNGVNASGGQRRLRQGTSAQYVNYELYRDAGRSSCWGTSLDTDTVKGTGTGSPQSISVFGRVPAGQTVAPGSYSDTVTVTITY